MAEKTRVVCPKCKVAYRLRTEARAGARVTCRKCGQEMIVPQPREAQGPIGRASVAGSDDDQQVSLAPGAEVEAATWEGDLAEESVKALLDGTGRAGSPRYIEQGVIGKGGMGQIVLCVERNTRRQVAMKRMLPATAAKPTRRARFVEEAQVTAQLEHPNIVPVHELATAEDGTIYFTMKLVKGRSLAEILRAARHGEESPSLGELLQVFLKVCDGVSFAHSRGVIHRDLKPGNIMVGDFGEVLVMDWGLAKVVGRADALVADAVGSSRAESGSELYHTQAGKAMGSPGYMAPEQAAGRQGEIDYRSDVYSLGAILYAMLALCAPVAGDDAREIVAKTVAGDIVAPERRAPNRPIPRELSAVAMKCLSLSPADRYQSVGALRRDISLFLEGRSVTAAPDTFAQGLVKLVKRNKPVSLSVALAAALLLTMGAIFTYDNMQKRKAAEDALVEAQASEAEAVTARQRQRATALAASKELAEQAIRSADQARWEEADIRAEAARKMLPDAPWGHYARGMVALARKDPEAARRDLRKALAEDPQHTPSKVALSQITALGGDLKKAVALLGDPGMAKDWHAFRTAGDTFYGQQRYREAERAYARAIELLAHPQYVPDSAGDWRALIALGDALLAGEFYADAKLAYERAQERMAEARAVPPEGPNRLADRLRKLQQKALRFRRQKRRLENRKGNARAWVQCAGFHESIRRLPAQEQTKRIAAKLEEIHGKAIEARYRIQDGVLTGVWFNRVGRLFLQPLAGLPLTDFGSEFSGVTDLGPLTGMPLKRFDCNRAGVSDLGPLRGMPLTRLHVRMNGDAIRDLSPLKGMPLTDLSLIGNEGLSDLGPLKGMPLTRLDLCHHWAASRAGQVRDLGPLEGMPLKELHCRGHRLSDLAPLRGMMLERLSVSYTFVTDLTHLKGMPLTELGFSQTGVSDLTPLKGMRLTGLACHHTPVHDLTPLRGMPLERLHLSNSKVTDLTPLAGMGLRLLDPPPRKQLTPESLKVIETLQKQGCKIVWRE